ncbi:MAG TPA: Ig domain-containing protein, partial [Bryobacteraceae bacterium]|nr:Ig domain-containing protein [Bryobacteraceae bacterium]
MRNSHSDPGAPAIRRHVTFLLLWVISGLWCAAAQRPTITTASLPDGTANSAYKQVLQASGGRPPYTWSIAAGSLPPGLQLGPEDGVVSGIPSQTGAYPFTAQVIDTREAIGTRGLQITIDPPLAITTASLPNGAVGAAYSQTLAAAGGSGNYIWSLASGSLPQGLTLAPSGAITGTPTTAGNASFTVQISDGNTTATKALGINVNPAALVITTQSLP